MKIIETKVSLAELKQMAEQRFGSFVKAVVDINKKIMVVDAELHADQEAFLIENGSRQTDLWGINIYPDKNKEELIEFDSMINLKPSLGNRTRSISDPAVKEQIVKIVGALIEQ